MPVKVSLSFCPNCNGRFASTQLDPVMRDSRVTRRDRGDQIRDQIHS